KRDKYFKTFDILKSCSTKNKYQTPIDIQTNTAKYDNNLKKIEYKNWDQDIDSKYLQLKNLGHNGRLQILPDYKNKPFVTFRNQIYELIEVHFHWGLTDKNGSNHAINGKFYASEIHLVGKNIKYPTLDIALEQNDGVLGITGFFDLDHTHNKVMAPIMKQWHQIQKVESMVPFNSSFNFAKLLPENPKSYYYYVGSTAYPKCGPTQWVIFKQTTKPGLSHYELSTFRTIDDNPFNGKTPKVLQNRRHLQPLNGRSIWSSD
ncbi:carbonic anhydrase 1-like, partial [Oppia nitens]|uniref:carbonic anhydrase 1-like n=1 Tax=Oppia nitens TaxID=1686743 RepID=UPI0023DC5A24